MSDERQQPLNPGDEAANRAALERAQAAAAAQHQ